MGNLFSNSHKFVKGSTMDTLLRWRIARWITINKKFTHNVEKAGKALNILAKMFPKASSAEMKRWFDKWEANSPPRYLRALHSLCIATKQYRRMYIKLWRTKAAILSTSAFQAEKCHRILSSMLAYAKSLGAMRNKAWRKFRAPVDKARACRYMNAAINGCIRRRLLAGFRRT